MKLNYNKTNRFVKISNYNLKLYKLHLFCKLVLFKKNLIIPSLNNIYLNKNTNDKTILKWTFFKRNITTPLRILRYSLYFDIEKLKTINLKRRITNKLVVYNGKKYL